MSVYSRGGWPFVINLGGTAERTVFVLRNWDEGFFYLHFTENRRYTSMRRWRFLTGTEMKIEVKIKGKRNKER